MDKTIKIVIAVLAVVIVAGMALLFTGTIATLDKGSGSPATIYFFYGEECPHCHNIMPFVENMTRKYPEADIRILEVWHNQTNHDLYQKANIAAGVKYPAVPQVIIGNVVLTGEPEIPERFEGLIQDYLKKKA